MDYDFITTCNWTSTGTYTLRAYRGSNVDVVTSYSLFYRKKGTTTWTETTNGQITISSTGDWEVGNDWNKSGSDVLTHSYFGITDIGSCGDVDIDETSLGTTVGNYFMYLAFGNCANLTCMAGGFNIPTGLTSVGSSFMAVTWSGCTSLASMPEGFDIPSTITSVGSSFMFYTWNNCTALTSTGDTEPIVFEFTGDNTFAGTCPITPDSPAGTKATPVSVEVARSVAPVASAGNATFFGNNF